LLNDIQEISEDLYFGSSYVGAPSIWITGLKIAGE